MTSDPFEHDLNALMAEYGAPADDAGFSNHVLAIAARRTALRRNFILAALFIAGLIAATQIKAAAKFAGKLAGNYTLDLNLPFDGLAPIFKISLPAPDAMSVSAAVTLYGCIALFGAITIWLAKDALDSQI